MSRRGRRHPDESTELAGDQAQQTEDEAEGSEPAPAPPAAPAAVERPLPPGRVRVRALKTTTGEGVLQYADDVFTLPVELARRLRDRGAVEIL